MTARRRRCAITRATAAKVTLAGLVVGFGALVPAGLAGADTVVPPLIPGDPAAPPPPGQPYALPVDGDAPPPAPPPAGPPLVPEIQNPQYGSGSSSGPLGFLRDAWHQAQDPYGESGLTPGQLPGATPPPPGAGPAPPLPPGYTSLTDPGSSGPPLPPRDYSGGPALPEGYAPLSGPPPPGYFDTPAPGAAMLPGAPIPADGPLLPTP